MTSLSSFLIFNVILVLTSGIRLQEASEASRGAPPAMSDSPLNQQSWPEDSPWHKRVTTQGYMGEPPEGKMAAAFGGGGCYSVVSQTGFLRGLLADDIGAGSGDVKLTVLSSSSGGSWLLGKFFENAPPGGVIDYYMKTGIPFVEKGKEQIYNKNKTKYLEGEFGRYCMWPELHHGRPPSEWPIEMMACAQCLGTAGDCETWLDLDPIFGIASDCVGENKDHQYRKADQVYMPPYPSPLHYSNGKDYPIPDVDWLRQQTLYLPKNRSLIFKDLAPVFHTEKFGHTQWSVFWAGVSPIGTIVPGTSGAAAQSEYNVADAVYMSSDAVIFKNVALTLEAAINAPTACPEYIKQVRAQTKMGGYPWPYATFPDVFEYVKPPALGKIFPNLGVDGAMMEGNGVGEAVRLLQNIALESRPRSLTSLITGSYDISAPFSRSFGNAEIVLAYFRPKVKWSTLFGSGIVNWNEKLGISKECELNNEEVNNPNHFFDYRVNGVNGDNCTSKVMLSSELNRFCNNFKYQALTTGFVFVREAVVVKNDFWGIDGGWKLTLMFSVLGNNPSADQWKLHVYGDDTLSYTKMADFPFPKGTESTGELKLDPFQAFALMNYNAYKGYMSRCALKYYHSEGKDYCNFCLHNMDVCKHWLPFGQKYFTPSR